MTKYLCTSSYIGKPFLIYDFAPDTFWISLNMRKISFLFYQCRCGQWKSCGNTGERAGGRRENWVVPRWKDLASSRNFGRITLFRRQKNASWSQAHKHEINIQRGLTYVVLFFLSIFFSFIRSWEAESILENLTQKLSRKSLSSLKKQCAPNGVNIA